MKSRALPQTLSPFTIRSQTSHTHLAGHLNQPPHGSKTALSRSELIVVRRSAKLLVVFSILFLVIGISGLFGLFESLFPPAHPELYFGSQISQPLFLQPPYNLAYFLPLLIPLTTYLVIARWTGEKHFRHS
ncbi:hypothetical protein IE53DRAFT_370297 [Violaceomyces palustris]|uniref:Uncharacterized protein n=1 Tax=Violaceomyces palustris TaxID=1673888 RepID=A0ACD0NSN7_9BASI|nr:hypothetical protein IE53DRAFT_370297 [Violaceomyces palustris]